MSSVDPNYVTPGVTITQLSSQAVPPGPGQQGILCLLGTAPKGTSDPKSFSSLADANTEYGSAADAGSLFNLEPGLEIAFGQAGVLNSLQVVAVRVGATQAIASVPQISGGQTAYALTARPSYAGKNTVTAVVGSPSYSNGSYQQSIALYDNTPSLAVVIENFGGATPQAVTDAINSASSLALASTAGGATGNSQNAFGQGGTYTLSGAVDGSAATQADYVAALAKAEGIDVDFVVALSGDAVVQQAVASHVSKMIGQQKYRQGILGQKYTGASEPNVVSQALQVAGNYSSQYLCLLANQGGYRRNPVTGLSQIYDGYFWAAALGAIKCINNPAEPLTRKPITGLLGLTENFPLTDLNSLAADGIIAIRTVPTMVINDGVDLGPVGNYRKENIVAQENRLIKIILAKVGPMIGTADVKNNAQAIRQRVMDALNAAAVDNQIIVGFDPTSLTVQQAQPPSTAGVYNVNIVYIPRKEVTRINFFLTLNLNIGG